VTEHAPRATRQRRQTPLDVVRGVLIGLAEVVPGVSGGTIALVTGVYDTLIVGAGHVVSGLRQGLVDLVRGRGAVRARVEMRRAHWSRLLPIGLGMVAAVIVGARILEPVLEEHIEQARAVFFGLILASLVVPIRLLTAYVGRRLTLREWLPGIVGAVAAFVLTGLPPGKVEDPPLIAVFLAASVAVCALVLPGVSGSFFLYTVGLYDATLEAVNERDLVYLGVFALGAIVGLASFVKLLQWLLEHRYQVTLVVMTGLMAGSLRALWPWQTEDRELLPPGDDVLQMVLLAVAGAAVVLALVAIEARMSSGSVQLPGGSGGPAHHRADDPARPGR
jgi:putative membrane protein